MQISSVRYVGGLRVARATCAWVVFVASLTLADGEGDEPNLQRMSLLELCGPSCVYALISATGYVSPPIADIGQACGIAAGRGTNLLSLKRYLEGRGYKVHAEKVGIGEIASGNIYLIPVRLPKATEYNHYNLILRRDGGVLTIFDGMGKVRQVQAVRLARDWDGECLRVAVAENHSLSLRKVPRSTEVALKGGSSVAGGEAGTTEHALPKKPEFAEVVLNGGDRIGKREVSCAQYALFLAALKKGTYRHERCHEPNCTRSHVPVQWPQGGGNDHVSDLPWYDAYAFAKWLGPKYRLPSRGHYRELAARLEDCREGAGGKAYFRGDPTDVRGPGGPGGLMGLLSGVREFTSDVAEGLAGQVPDLPQGQIYVFEVKGDKRGFAFSSLPANGGDSRIGFRVVREGDARH